MFCFRNVIKLINFDKKVNNRIIQTAVLVVGVIFLSLTTSVSTSARTIPQLNFRPTAAVKLKAAASVD